MLPVPRQKRCKLEKSLLKKPGPFGSLLTNFTQSLKFTGQLQSFGKI
ncbi:MAG: hypothetical protein RLZZ338_4228 [Cyanobacteriota bacterium]|jgi:hypothetical protein